VRRRVWRSSQNIHKRGTSVKGSTQARSKIMMLSAKLHRAGLV
jgi:hypothetical protein